MRKVHNEHIILCKRVYFDHKQTLLPRPLRMYNVSFGLLIGTHQRSVMTQRCCPCGKRSVDFAAATKSSNLNPWRPVTRTAVMNEHGAAFWSVPSPLHCPCPSPLKRRNKILFLTFFIRLCVRTANRLPQLCAYRLLITYLATGLKCRWLNATCCTKKESKA